MRKASNPFGANKTATPPAVRRPDLESTLCRAIKDKVLVTLTYKGDGVTRTFQPSAVYHTTTGKVCVSGVQITNPLKPADNLEPHNFEVGLINSLTLTDRGWIVADTFDRFDKKYAKGIICP
jgi:hypothetical protein